MNESGNKNETINDNEDKNGTINENIYKNKTINENGNKNENDKCWYCSGLYSDKDNPLICLCNCNDFVHYKCLKMFFDRRITIEENSKKTVKTFFYQQFNCDICLKPYHLRFRIPEFDKIYELIDLNLPEKEDYACLESLDYIKDKKKYKNSIYSKIK